MSDTIDQFKSRLAEVLAETGILTNNDIEYCYWLSIDDGFKFTPTSREDHMKERSDAYEFKTSGVSSVNYLIICDGCCIQYSIPHDNISKFKGCPRCVTPTS